MSEPFVPPGWVPTVIGELGKIHCGQSPSTNSVNGDRVGMIYVSGPEHWDGHRVHVDKWTTEPKRVVPSGCIFITVKGSGVGKIFPGISAAIGRDIYAFEPDSEMSKDFIRYTLIYTIEELKREAVGDIPGLSKVHIEDHSLFFPPAPEQHRIVEALESYLTRLDDAVASLERVQRNLKRYRASVLKAAVEGKLVPTEAELARREKRDYEPASVLLARILKERKRRIIEETAEKARAKAESKAKKTGKAWTEALSKKTLAAERAKAAKKYKEPKPPDTSELPSLPEGWCWATTEALAWDLGYGTSQKCTFDSEGPPVLRIPNVQNELLSFDNLKFANGYGKLKSDGVLRSGDFIFIRTNGSLSLIGRGGVVVQDPPGDYHFASYLIRLRLVDFKPFPRWFGIAWHSHMVRNQLLKDASSSAGQHNVSLSSAKRYCIPLPPRAEQERILGELERTQSLVAAARDQIEVNERKANRLRQAILKWAFEGKLVDQDSNDEPASVLLERIKAQKAETEKTKKPTRRGRKKRNQ